MAQLLAPAAPDSGRISQVLPTVKCSSCNYPVPIHELGDHVCTPGSATESSFPINKPPSLISPLAAIELDPESYQGEMAFPASKTLQAQQPVSSHQVSSPASQHTSVSARPEQTRMRAPSLASRPPGGGDGHTVPHSGPGRPRRGSQAPRPMNSRSGGAALARINAPLVGPHAPIPSAIPFPTAVNPYGGTRSPPPDMQYQGMPFPTHPESPVTLASTAGLRSPPLPPNALQQQQHPVAMSQIVQGIPIPVQAPRPHQAGVVPHQIQPERSVAGARANSPGPYAHSEPRGTTSSALVPQSQAPSERARTASNASRQPPPSDDGYEVIYSTSDYRNGPLTAPLPSRSLNNSSKLLPQPRPRFDSAASASSASMSEQHPYQANADAYSLETLLPPRPRVDSTASLPPIQSLRVRAPSTASLGPMPQSTDTGRRPSFERRPSNLGANPPPPPPRPQALEAGSRSRSPSSAGGRSMFDRRPSNLGANPMTASAPAPPVPTYMHTSSQPPVSSRAPMPPLNTNIGGEAGMAGVGRRGFAAAAMAQTATFVRPSNTPNHPGAYPGTGSRDSRDRPDMQPGQGMDGRRANAPRFLDIASVTNLVQGNTPPLSPHSPHSASTISPRSPLSQKSPLSAGLPSPLSRTNTPTPAIASPSSPAGRVSSMHRERVFPPAAEPPKVPLPATPGSAAIRLPFLEKFKEEKGMEGSQFTYMPGHRPRASDSDSISLPSPRADSESDYDGLPYERSDAGDDDDRSRKDGAGSASKEVQVHFPSMAGSESHYSPISPTSPESSHHPPIRSLSASTVASSYTARSAKSTGALDRLDRAMETLLEDTAALGNSSTPLSPEVRAGKLPTRSHTSPTLPAGRQEKHKHRKEKRRVCAKCAMAIEDGRWIQMEGGSVLCEQCWKNMYLPKCRRCNLTIEKQAVSSSDGQLKGKYHKECFNCHTCHKPFPDKSFYVFDGKPFCAYHYHEANKSLCAAGSCGQPIEGPCAVSHSGRRYHPDHLLCEYPQCTERLVDYWELDGRMLCKRHVQQAVQESAEENDELDGLPDVTLDARAMKRTTRFIDLAGFGGSELQ